MSEAIAKYLIDGKYDGTAMGEAKTGIETLEKAGERLKTVLKAAFAAFTVRTAFNFGQEAVDLYGEQERAEIRLGQAIKNNTKVTGEAFNRLRQYASQVQQGSIFGDETIINEMSKLTALGLAEDQITSITDAAVNLASATDMSLEGAFRNVSKTLSGMTGELGEAIPALRELTQEQLRNGEAVDVIMQQYGGMAESIAAGSQGVKQQFQNTWGDIMEGIGGVMIPVFNEAMNHIKPLVDNLSLWFNENRDKIINGFRYFPEVAAVTFATIGKMFRSIFEAESFISIVDSMGEALIASFKIAFQIIGAIWNGVIGIFHAGAAAFGENFWKYFINGWTSVIFAAPRAMKRMLGFDESTDLIRFNVDPPTSDQMDEFFAGIGTGFAEAFAPVRNGMTEAAQEWKETGDAIGAAIRDDAEAGAAAINRILNRPKDTASSAGNQYDGSLNTDGGSPIVESLTAASDAMSQFASMFSGAEAAFMSMATGIESVNAVMNPFQTILEGFVDVAGPVIDAVLAPLVTGMQALGMIIADMLTPVYLTFYPILETVTNVLLNVVQPILNLLTPYLALVASYFEIMAPIIKLVATAFTILASPVQWLGDLFKWVADTIRTAVHNLAEIISHPFNASKRDIWSMPGAFTSDAFTGLEERINDIWDASSIDSSSIDSSTVTSGSATVTQQPDIYFYITVEGNIVGDGGVDEFVDMLIDRMAQQGAISTNANIVVGT